MDKSIREKSAAEQADAILALEGDTPDATSQALRAALDRGEITADMYRDQTRARAKELHLQPIAGRFDLKHLQDVHRHIFQDVYEWAGQLRTVGISKGDHRFVPPEQLRTVGTMVFGRLAADQHLRGREKPEFLDGLTKHYAAINAMHPFRQGNGRSTQTFVGELGRSRADFYRQALVALEEQPDRDRIRELVDWVEAYDNAEAKVDAGSHS